ncbi:MAG: hypothetical protein A2W31_12270 [Planctomycetes bacterium RBG_16_64_10]|nr:MAG: hypothetical protein A2W31_12270 [Planctomycetes bacterium RBG_16_64_10]
MEMPIMPDNPSTIREVAWQDLCPWLILLRTIRIALSFRVLALAAVALVALAAGWWVIGGLFAATNDPLVQGWIEAYGTPPWEEHVGGQIGAVSGREAVRASNGGRIESVLRGVPLVGAQLPVGPIFGVWRRLSDPFIGLFHGELGIVGLAYLVLCCLWAVAIWALFAGAITRIAALALTRDESLGPKSALVRAATKWRDYVAAPLLPLGGVLLATGLLFVVGVVLRLADAAWWTAGPLWLLAGLLWPIVLLIGFLLAIIVFALLAGWPLLWPAVSVERADAFDAVSNSYAYVYQRPLHYLFYLFVATLLGLVGALVVNIFAAGVIDLSNWGVSWGRAAADALLGGAATLERGWLDQGGQALVDFWTGCVTTVQQAFSYGFFWTAATAIYLLLRRDVDAKEMDEVADDEQDEAGGLPPLTGAESGVPQVADGQAAGESAAERETPGPGDPTS